MNTQQQQLIKKYTNLLLRHKKIFIAILYLSLAAGLGKYLTTPKSYQATSMIMYQQSRVSPSKMSPDETKQLGQMVRTVTEQVMSRTNLEELIKQFGLYKEQLAALPIEDVLDSMRKKIKVDTSRGSDVFTVSFQDGNPQVVMRVTNAIAAKFIEENLRVREEKVSETKAYVTDELEMSKTRLDKKEALMRDYKLKHYNEMHENLPSNIARLNSLQDQYQKNLETTQSLEQTRALVQEQLSSRKEKMDLMQKQLAFENDVFSLDEEGGGEQPDLAQLKAQLESLLARYTSSHPDVKRLQKAIEQAQNAASQRAEAEGKKEVPGGGKNGVGFPAQIAADPAMERLFLQLKEIENNLQNLRNERQSINEQTEQFKLWIDAAPVREAEWAALIRDYEELKRNYEALVTSNLSAESAASLERRQKGSQFKIIDPAPFPERPTSPDFRKIMLLALIFGIGSGGGIAFLIDFFDTSFKDPYEIESYVGIPVICAIPVLRTAAELKRERKKTWMWSFVFSVSSCCLIGSFIFFWWRGLIV